MNRIVKKILLLFIFLAPKLEKLFGLSQLRWKTKPIKVLTLSSRAIIISFIILYPVSFMKVLTYFQTSESGVTMYARNITFAFNWLLLVLIFANETFDADHHQRGFGGIKRLFCKLIEIQSLKDNLVLLLRCTMKMTVVFVGLFYTSYKKYTHRMKAKLTLSEQCLEFFLYLPFIIMALASNRIYIANNVVKRLLTINACELKTAAPDDALSIKLCAINHSRFNSFFVAFNKRNAINLLVILSFCLLNIVYEVIKSRTCHMSSCWISITGILFLSACFTMLRKRTADCSSRRHSMLKFHNCLLVRTDFNDPSLRGYKNRFSNHVESCRSINSDAGF